MILNTIKKLYFTRVDEAKGAKPLTPKQEKVAGFATNAIQGISAPEGGEAKLNQTGELTGFVRQSADNDPQKAVRFVSHSGFNVNPMQVMKGGIWANSRNKDIRNGSNPAWVTILNDFLGAEAEEAEEGVMLARLRR